MEEIKIFIEVDEKDPFKRVGLIKEDQSKIILKTVDSYDQRDVRLLRSFANQLSKFLNIRVVELLEEKIITED